MALNFDVVIETPEYSVDMKSGLDTLQGVSDAARYIAETVLGERVPERQTHKAKVRTILRRSFEGSYGQRFSIDVYDEKLQTRLRKVGHVVFAELVSYYLKESMYADPGDLSAKAQSVVDELGELSEDLVQQLRISSLKNIHEVAIKFDHEVKIRYRKSSTEQIVLAKFDIDSAQILETVQSNKNVDIVAGITRLNTHTGNGRLQLIGENETVAFGFDRKYSSVEIVGKKQFSENLHYNNGKPMEHWHYLKLSAATLQLHDGKIVKYIITGWDN